MMSLHLQRVKRDIKREESDSETHEKQVKTLGIAIWESRLLILSLKLTLFLLNKHSNQFIIGRVTTHPILKQAHKRTHTTPTPTHTHKHTHTPNSSSVTPQLSAYESSPAPRLRSSVDRVYGNMLILSSGIYTDTILLSACQSVRQLKLVKLCFAVELDDLRRLKWV